MHFTLRQTEAFLAVAAVGSFTRASELLHLSPSAVSQLINELETALGYTVFDRTTRRVDLSAAGRAFMPSAEALCRQFSLTKMAALDIKNQASGLVRVAAPMVVACVMLPRLMAQYARIQPNVVLRLVDCPVEELVLKVANREVDLAIGPDRPVGPEVERVELYPSPWVAWCAPWHPFARRASLSWSDLASENLVAAGRDYEIHLNSIFRQLPVPLRATPSQVVNNVSSALGLAAAGLCYTITPSYVEALALPLGLVMREITSPIVLREMSLFQPADRTLSPAAAGFGEHIISALSGPRPSA
ncbi:LysR family transcriptional regulator [Curvibacter gracilis]|uniref:LysR family transcriptional regulator n=1 Tax=Curvibacter gracilis TaxID=230310 RepID=UPI0004AFA751|nr:LysR family transcriptional regulator [Curvibacter gracilis]